MSVIRIAKHTENFSIIANTGAKDPTLTPKAKGVLWYLLTLPDYWEINMAELQRHFNGGRRVIESAIQELITFRYVIKSRYRDEQGRFQTDYIVFEQPQPKTSEKQAKSSTVQNVQWTKPPEKRKHQEILTAPVHVSHCGKTTVENVHLLKTNREKTKKINAEPSQQKFSSHEDVWSQVLSQLKSQINPPSFNTWLRPTSLLSTHNGTWRIEVPDEVFLYWLNEYYADVLQEVITTHTGTQPNLEFVVNERGQEP